MIIGKQHNSVVAGICIFNNTYNKYICHHSLGHRADLNIGYLDHIAKKV